jgi:hypothetical protein
MTDMPQFDLAALARQAADQHLAVINGYNETAVSAESSDKPKLSDLTSAAKAAANRDEDPDKDAMKLVNAHEKALTAANLARRALAEYGAKLKGIDFADVVAEPDDEEKSKAQESRKQLTAILRIAAQTENGSWANDYQIPNVGREGSTTISAEGTKRHRVTVKGVKGDVTKEWASFSALALTKKSDRPDLDVDKLRQRFEQNGPDKVFTVEVDGWTVTVTPQSK